MPELSRTTLLTLCRGHKPPRAAPQGRGVLGGAGAVGLSGAQKH